MQAARTAMQAYENCDAERALPADDPAFVEPFEARGQEEDGSFCDRLVWTVQASERSDSRRRVCLISGHGGCGKSTELLRLRKALVKEGWAVAYFDVAVELQLNDLETSDILVTLAEKVAEIAEREGKGFDKEALRLVYDFFGNEEEIRESSRTSELEAGAEVSAKAGLLTVFQLMASFRANIKGSEQVRKTYRRTIQKNFANFASRLNTLIHEAESALKRKGRKGLVVIVDSLEKLPYDTDDHGVSTHDKFFLRDSEVLKSPECRVFYTVPITLRAEGQIADSYGDKTEDIPMVDLRNEYAHAALCDLVRKRIDCETVFQPGADIGELVDASGGCVRDLLQLCRKALLRQTEPVSAHRLQFAIESQRKDYDLFIRDTDIPRIVQCQKEQHIDYDEVGRRLLHVRVILEYENGDRHMAPHPAVAQNRRVLEYKPQEATHGSQPH